MPTIDKNIKQPLENEPSNSENSFITSVGDNKKKIDFQETGIKDNVKKEPVTVPLQTAQTDVQSQSPSKIEGKIGAKVAPNESKPKQSDLAKTSQATMGSHLEQTNSATTQNSKVSKDPQGDTVSKTQTSPQDPKKLNLDPKGTFRANQSKWTYEELYSDDPLLSCLEIIAGILGSPTSATALKANLPLETGFLTPGLFVRAASRAGLSARLVQKRLQNLTKYTLPCVLLLQGDKACLLVDFNPEERTYDVIFPETGKSVVPLAEQDLQSLYAGIAIFVKKQYHYDQRSADISVDKPQAWFWGTLKKSWRIYIQVAFAAILINLFAIATPLFTMNVYDRVVPNSAVDTLWFLAFGILFVFLFDFILKTVRVYFVDTAGKKADILLASRLFETIMNMQLASKPKSSGGFANEIREFETLRDFFSSATLVAFIDLPFVFLFLMIVYLIGGPIAYVPLTAVPLIIIGAYLFHTPLTDWVRRTFREGAQKHALLVEAINGLETIKSFTAEGRMQRNWERFVAQSSDSSKALKFFAAIALNYSAFIQQTSYVLVIIVGVYLITKGDATTGVLVACSILSARALAPLAQMVALLTRLNQSMTALKALDEVIRVPSERPKGKSFLYRPVLRGDLEFKNVSFSYPEQEILALSQFNLKINAGEKVGFLGRIGSGKTTLERLTLGLYEPTQGSVLVDNTDIRQIDPADLRKNIGYVPQDIYLFFGTLRENITFGSIDIDEHQFRRAVEVSGVMDFVHSHPAGFDMPIGEGGANLSGGQRQSVAIARALVRNPSVFLMDEPTAMMDHASEARLTARFSQYLDDRTVLLITHRVPLLKLVNRIVVLDGGRIVADGPRDKIMKMLSNSQVRTSK